MPHPATSGGRPLASFGGSRDWPRWRPGWRGNGWVRLPVSVEGGRWRLVSDSCDQVQDAAAELIEGVVARSDTVKVLATSREGLRVADEQLWPVPSLDVHHGTESAAATLFVDRAQAVSPGVS